MDLCPAEPGPHMFTHSVLVKSKLEEEEGPQCFVQHVHFALTLREMNYINF